MNRTILYAGAGLVGFAAGLATDRAISDSPWRQQHRRSPYADPIRDGRDPYVRYGIDEDGDLATPSDPPGRLATDLVTWGSASGAMAAGIVAGAFASSGAIDRVASRRAPVIAATTAALLLTGMSLGAVTSRSIWG